MIGANEIITGERETLPEPQKQYSPGQIEIIAGEKMHFSHWVTTANGLRPFFHYYVDGKQYGYIKNDKTITL